MSEVQNWRSARERTAIGRRDLSMPARLAVRDGVLETGQTVLDFGSGRGQDVERLCGLGHRATGWDPYFARSGTPEPADVVLMTYVLNVVEDESERRSALQQAWSLSRRVLVVSTRLSWEKRRVPGVDFGDGVLTGRETFQRLFAPAELRALVASVTERVPASPAPGVVYVFRTEADRLNYLARSAFPGFSWQQGRDLGSALGDVIAFAHQRGRFPGAEEIPPEVRSALGERIPTAWTRVARKAVDPEAMAAGARRTTLDTLLFLGMARFEKPPRMSNLPDGARRDVRAHFGSFRDACMRADRLLLKISDDVYVRNAMRNSVGKLTPTALYVHRRAVGQMPVVLRLYEYCAAVTVGRPREWNVLKLHHDARRVAWSSYPDFDTDPHPRLAWTLGVCLPGLETSFQDYRSWDNRPLLHRKEEFVAGDDPSSAMFARLTAAEVRADLYVDPSAIGLERGWEATLERSGVALRGHRLVRRPK